MIRRLALIALVAAVGSATPAEGKTFVLCNDEHGNTVERVKPRICSFHVAEFGERAVAASADFVDVITMRWRTWGGRAVAVGTYAGDVGFRRHGRVRLSRRRRCVGYGHVTTHFRMRLRGDAADTFDFRLDGCDGP